MVYWLIALIVFLALAPLWHFMPTRRQRTQAKLRETAALEGLFVEFRDLPLPQRYLERMSASDRQVLYYGRRLRPARGAVRRRGAWWRAEGEWRRVPGDPEAPSVAADMPAAVLALAINDASCGCYWQEEGDQETVRDIARLLTRWEAELTGAL